MDTKSSTKGITIQLGELFNERYPNFSRSDKQIIFQFTTHLQEHGFFGLSGRNKPSTDVHRDDPYFLNKLNYAKDNNLWHYHIGIPYYDETNNHGDWTSEWVLHYQVITDTEIKIVDLGDHPPFKLPKPEYLK